MTVVQCLFTITLSFSRRTSIRLRKRPGVGVTHLVAAQRDAFSPDAHKKSSICVFSGLYKEYRSLKQAQVNHSKDASDGHREPKAAAEINPSHKVLKKAYYLLLHFNLGVYNSSPLGITMMQLLDAFLLQHTRIKGLKYL